MDRKIEEINQLKASEESYKQKVIQLNELCLSQSQEIKNCEEKNFFLSVKISELKKSEVEKANLLETNEKIEENLKIQENLKNKEKILSLELDQSEKNKKISELNESYKVLLEKNQNLQTKILSLKSQQSILETEYFHTKSSLEQQIFSLETEIKALKDYSKSIEIHLKLQNEGEIQQIHSKNNENLQNLQIAHDKQLKSLQETLFSLSSHQKHSEDSQAEIIKSLQFELLKEKTSSKENKQSQEYFYELNEKIKIIEKLENNLNDCLNALTLVNEILWPVYENYANQQQD